MSAVRGKKFNKVKRGGARRFTPEHELTRPADSSSSSEASSGSESDGDLESPYGPVSRKPQPAAEAPVAEAPAAVTVTETAAAAPTAAQAASFAGNRGRSRPQTGARNVPANRADDEDDLAAMTRRQPGELSKRERAAVEQARAKERFWKAQAEGKTEQARADLARLAIIRKQREESSAQRAREAAASTTTSRKADSLAANKALGKKP
ncbi:hypothetical protein CXG81DRAFT_23218 [Caulochytrium protostelioides]|uniref:Casein kinase substrate phosphoprotein PP28 domain-containing protein n=1 Tax=Caulochytrium protostelioides TaxID=1555241 RepID=A0A4P9X271_9FUNG|nr:hypothetical protein CAUPRSCDRAFT_10260 [Caulochytrium protostelioides]RKP04109.1 hypothetical protein CXG81DRAFT_23218 [Caulochytrium protostelioides]|eukprot:RKP04109.1 hypothetical protein CXG81DRAFT_23218 [Caulochytrium protostelioides]